MLAVTLVPLIAVVVFAPAPGADAHAEFSADSGCCSSGSSMHVGSTAWFYCGARGARAHATGT